MKKKTFFLDDSNEYLGIPEEGMSRAESKRRVDALDLSSHPFPVEYYSFSADIERFFKANKAVLGYWCEDIETARAHNARYEPYSVMSEYHFASSTIGLPGKEGALVARAVVEELCECTDLDEMETIVSSISLRGLQAVTEYYSLDPQNTEVLYDDNATMALFQFMSYLPLRKYDTTLTFFDTGRVIPRALRGTNPEKNEHNFRPVVDVFGNHERLEKMKISRNIDQLVLFNIEHFIEESHQTDEQLLDDILYIVQTSKPKVLLIPTVTRLGRKVDFVEVCKQIKEIQKNERGYEPWVILDDAQGVLRLEQGEYQGGWQHYDAILQTGAKVTGALMGAGVIAFNKGKFSRTQIPFEDSKLLYRARKYGLASPDHKRMHQFNAPAHGVLNTPELASLIIELGKTAYTKEIDETMQVLRSQIAATLSFFSNHIKVMEPEEGVHYVNSIIGFYFKNLKGAGVDFKRKLASSDNTHKVILPALVTPENDQDPVDHYLRIALNPKACTGERAEEYKSKIDFLTKRLKEVVWELIGEHE